VLPTAGNTAAGGRCLQKQPPNVLAEAESAPACASARLPGHQRNDSTAEELHGNVGIKSYSGIFVLKNTSPKHLQITFPAACFSEPPVPCASGCVESNTNRV